METPRESIKRVFEVRKDLKILDKYAREVFYKHFENDKIQVGTWRGYDRFEIISENEIKIYFNFGAGDMEFDGDFIHTI